MRYSFPKFNDFHAHWRRLLMMEQVIEDMRGCGYGYVLGMPNTDPIIATAQDLVCYRDEVEVRKPDFTPIYTVYLTPQTTPETIRGAKAVGAVGAKLYPVGKKSKKEATTRSQFGIPLAELVYSDPVFREMELCRVPLLLHGEDPDVEDHAEREEAFLPVLEQLAMAYPDLPIVLEHVSSRAGINAVRKYENVFGTITVHHLVLTREDWQGNPHNLCMPVAKTEDDRLALLQAAMSGDPKFFLGTDSAPHPIEKKECEAPSFGVYSARVAPSLLVDIFHKADELEMLPGFASIFGRSFYRLPEIEGAVEFIDEPWTVPERYGNVVPLYAGKQIGWRIAP